MITLTYEQVRNKNFAAGLLKLANHSGFDPKVAYNIAKIVDKTRQFDRDCNKIHNDVVVELCSKDKDGNMMSPNGPGSFEIPTENFDKFQKKMDELKGLSVEIERYRVKLSDIEEVGLTPEQLLALEPVMTELEVVEEKEATSK